MTLMHMKIPKSLNTKHSQDARHNKKTVECAGEREREFIITSKINFLYAFAR
jgi:hypothetical protein